jgi:hypothetical protein
VYGSEPERELIIAPQVWHAEAPEVVLARRPPGATHTPFMYQARGVRLPLNGAPETLGKEALRALLAMRMDTFAPWSLPLQCASQYINECVPELERRQMYEHLVLSTRDTHWMTLSCVYDDLDDADLVLHADMRIALSPALIGNWLLRTLGAIRALRNSHETWWRPRSDESGY